ncbi:porin [Arcobacter peruensis]|uniref:porin n=1 Tax=Arcobacter peruensis TaxID=2320140 RepID=UPI000F08436C|nr:porin [Arcobacter peruensis]
MKKIAKLSLVAAVAVAGLTNVNAASLEEAIKGVDVSGQFRFRAQDKSDVVNNGVTTATAENGTDVEIEVGVKVPVTENVTAVFKIDNAPNNGNNEPTTDALDVEDYYFSYNAGALTVNAGQQNIPGRITDGAQGDGLVALYNLGNFTVGAAAFNNHDAGTNDVAAVNFNINTDTGVTPATTPAAAVVGNSGKDLYSVIAMGTVGPVSLLGQYADVADTLNTYNLKADVAFQMVKVGAEYTESDVDGSSAELSTAKAYVSGKVGIVSAKLSYAKTGSQGSGSLHSVAGGAAAGLETPAEALLWNIGTSARAGYEAYTIDASVAVTPKISLRAAYSAGEQGPTDLDVTEALGQISYKVAKNLTTYVRFADVEDQGDEYTRGRVEARYSF